MNIASWLPILKLLPLAFVAGIGAQIASGVLNLSGDKENLREQVRRLEGRLQGAIVRIERRDAAIRALPNDTRIKVEGWVKNGNAPEPFEPFKDTKSGQ